MMAKRTVEQAVNPKAKPIESAPQPNGDVPQASSLLDNAGEESRQDACGTVRRDK